MTVRSWLYGPDLTAEVGFEGRYILRPMTLNVDDLRDLDTKFRSLANPAALTAQAGRPGIDTYVTFGDIDALLAIPAYERQIIIYSTIVQAPGSLMTGHASVQLGTESNNLIIGTTDHARTIVFDVADLLTASAQPRIPQRQLSVLFRTGLWLLAAGTYATAASLVWSPRLIPLLIVVLFALGVATHVASHHVASFVVRHSQARRGTTLRYLSRADFEERRQNSRRDLRVFAYTGLPGLVIGALLGALFRAWIS